MRAILRVLRLKVAKGFGHNAALDILSHLAYSLEVAAVVELGDDVFLLLREHAGSRVMPLNAYNPSITASVNVSRLSTIQFFTPVSLSGFDFFDAHFAC